MDPYQVLGVEKTASPEKIKWAYRRRAAKAHPDNQETGNRAEFEQLFRAQKLLCNSDTRELYDKTGIVAGEDVLMEKALMMIVGLSGECVMEDPEGSLVLNIKGKLVKIRRHSDSSLASIEKALENIEKRWAGAESVKSTIVMSLEARILEFRKQIAIIDKAYLLLQDARYAQSERPTPFASLSSLSWYTR